MINQKPYKGSLLLCLLLMLTACKANTRQCGSNNCRCDKLVKVDNKHCKT